LALGILCLSLVIVVVDDTVLNVALPSLVEQLGANHRALQWAVDAYIIVFGGLLFLGGSLGDRYGRKRTLQAGLLLFGATSLWAGLARSAEELVIARACQGAGAALIMPSTLSLLVHIFPPSQLPGALGIWSGASGLGIILGPLLAGLLLSRFWWGSVFLINLPVVAVALLAGALVLPESAREDPPPLDLGGTVLSILGFSTLLYAIISGPELPPARAGLTMLASALLLASFVAWELRTPRPMVEVRLLVRPAMAVPAVVVAGAFFMFVGNSFALTQFLQLAQGRTPLAAGLIMMPLSIAWSGFAALSPGLCARWGDRAVIAAGLLAAAAAFSVQAAFSLATPTWAVVADLLVLGTGMGIVSTPVTRLIMSAAPLELSGMASATNNVTRQLGAALGVAVLGALLAECYRMAMRGYGRPEAMDNLGEALRRVPELAEPARLAFLGAFATVNWTCAGLAAALAALAWAKVGRGSACVGSA